MRSSRLCRQCRLGASFFGVMAAAACLAWIATTGRYNTDLHFTGIDTEPAAFDKENIYPDAKPQYEHIKHKELLSVFAEYDKSSSHTDHKLVQITAPVTAHKKTVPAVKTVKAPNFPAILKMVADDDFNLTCHHSVPMQGPRKFIKNSKNPCYWDEADDALKCLPYFYVPGFPKCGTTDFYNTIKEHPEFVRSGKEHHWFNHLQYTKKYGNFEMYLHHFKTLANRIQNDLKSQSFSKKITGDFTPDYLCDSIRWKCMEGNERIESPQFTNAHAIQRLNPDAKFIILLRDPVERLYSRFKHMIHVAKPFRNFWGAPTPEVFHEAAMKAIHLYSDCFQNHPERHCLYNGTLFNQAMMNDIGLYPLCLEDWVNLFPKENFLFIQFEDYIASRARTFERVLEFLDMGPVTGHQLKNAMNSTKVHNPSYFKGQPMLNKTREALRLFFSPFVQDLKKIVGENLIQSWGY